jgi:hypothetical protein
MTISASICIESKDQCPGVKRHGCESLKQVWSVRLMRDERGRRRQDRPVRFGREAVHSSCPLEGKSYSNTDRDVDHLRVLPPEGRVMR